MSRASKPEEPITELLAAASEGDADAREEVWERVYPDLKEIAHRELGRGRSGDTLQTTSLVHEAYLKVVDRSKVAWKDRIHFYSMASRAMRHILVDYARTQGRQKRGGGEKLLSLQDRDLGVEAFSEELLDLDKALDQLATVDERAVRVVECRYFTGLGVDETAEVLDVSPRTVKRDWSVARAYLLRELQA